MADAERADGFWWVRVVTLDMTRAWRPLWLRDDSLFTHDPDRGGELVAVSGWVPPSGWGPYLGKEPGHGKASGATLTMTTTHAEGCDGKACDGSKKCRTVWATERLPSYDPTADHEGEQTRAIDGAFDAAYEPREGDMVTTLVRGKVTDVGPGTVLIETDDGLDYDGQRIWAWSRDVRPMSEGQEGAKT